MAGQPMTRTVSAVEGEGHRATAYDASELRRMAVALRRRVTTPGQRWTWCEGFQVEVCSRPDGLVRSVRLVVETTGGARFSEVL